MHRYRLAPQDPVEEVRVPLADSAGLGIGFHQLHGLCAAAATFDSQRAGAGIKIQHPGAGDDVESVKAGKQCLLDAVGGGAGQGARNR
ncbi:hypothetical protein G205_02768 [Arthrobacter nitrophenolicus]|uniref:Uncharacterized protein n=1 Tax=Arthrobacter nitrophenolicus TaxID=683150 RepID=L8TRD9_9MICC|nr:hypothetical protein G205_02768 [Arthrobacter nitrophenolicus]